MNKKVEIAVFFRIPYFDAFFLLKLKIINEILLK
jgi:hypothetical protein